MKSIASRVVPVVLVFAVGAAAGWVARSNRNDAPHSIHILMPQGTTGTDHKLSPFTHYDTNGTRTELREAEYGGPAWKIKLVYAGRTDVFVADSSKGKD